MATLPDELGRAAPLLNLQPKGNICTNTNSLGIQVTKGPHVCMHGLAPLSLSPSSPHPFQAGSRSGLSIAYLQAVLSSTRPSETLCHHLSTMSERQMSVQKAPARAFHVAGLLSQIPLSLSSGTRMKSFVEAVLLWKPAILVPQADLKSKGYMVPTEL